MRTSLLAALFATGMLALPSTALSASAEFNEEFQTTVFQADPGEDNTVVTGLEPCAAGSCVYVKDTEHDVTAGHRCEHPLDDFGDPDTEAVVCPPGPVAGFLEDGFDSWTGDDSALEDIVDGGPDIDTLYGGGGDDALEGGPGEDNVDGKQGDDEVSGGDDRDTVFGDSGNDTLAGGGDDDQMLGGAGNDVVHGDGGNDELSGESGNDSVDGGTGDDTLERYGNEGSSGGGDNVAGGSGSDFVSYDDRSDGVAISLDDQPNDSDGDNVHSDIESLGGGLGNDNLVGNGGPNSINGNQGNDAIDGAGGNDVIDGSIGNDTVLGGVGDDDVQGSSDADVVDGGPGRDTLRGDPACSIYACSGGADEIRARDGEGDTVSCGVAADRVIVDQLDAVAGDCEVVDRASVTTIVEPLRPNRVFGLRVAKSIKRKVLLRRGLAVRVTCSERCAIAPNLRYKRKKLGATRKRLSRAGTKRFRVKLSRKGKRTVRRLRKGKRLTLRVTFTDAAGRKVTLVRSVKLKR